MYRGGGLALARSGLFARAVVRCREPVRSPVVAGRPALEHTQRRSCLALQGTDAERHPLARVLQAMGLGVAALVGLLEALGLDPHALALEQAEDAGLTGLGALVLAVVAGELGVVGVVVGVLVRRA